MTQGAAEWIAVQCDAQVAAVYLTESEQGQVLRGIHRDPSAIDVLPSRLWWRGGAEWISGTEVSMRVVPWSLGRQSGLVVVGPFPPGVWRQHHARTIDAGVRRLVAPLAAGLDRYNNDRRTETSLLEAVGYEVGAGIDGSALPLLEAIRDHCMAERVDLVGDEIVVRGAQVDVENVVARARGWIALIRSADDDATKVLLTLFGMADLYDARTPETVGRSVQVAELAVQLGVRIGLDAAELAIVRETARLARISGTLTGMAGAAASAPDDGNSRWATIGASLLSGAGRPVDVCEAVRCVAERWDGRGALGLADHDIPLAARIVAVAAAWVDRTNGSAWSGPCDNQMAARMMVAGAHRQFDPHIVGTLLEVSDAAAL